MNRASKCILTALAFLLLSASLVYGQVTPGTPPLGSFGGGPFDTINLGNLDVHFAIPILQKAGRGLSMSDALTYDTSIWSPGIMNGQPTWTNVTNWGWQNLYGNFPVVSYGVVFSTGACGIMGQSQYSKWEYTNFVYHDASGTTHPFGTDWVFFSSPGGNLCPPNGQQPPTLPPASTAYDNSGFVLTITTAGQSPAGYVNSPDGSTINESFVMTPPSSVGSFTITDSNGNQISAASGVYTDTLGGSPALTVTGSGTSTSPIQYAYTGPGGTKSYHANFALYHVKTQFLCGGINDADLPGVSLVSSITLPDDDGVHLDRYTFTYEATPGFPPGYTTGRLASVTLPTGGTISYLYNGINGGILCADGSTLAVSRTVNPGGTWDYTRSGAGNSWATTVKDPTTPTRNQTVISFEKAIGASNNFYETQRQSYLGSVQPVNLLLTTVTCYNNTTSNCPTASVVTPITETDVTLQYPSGGLQSKSKTVYNTYGLATEIDQYAYSSSAPTTVAQSTQIVYDTLGNGIVNRPKTVTVFNGTTSAPIKSKTTYTNDSHGNVTTVAVQTNSSGTTLYHQFSYNSNGTLHTSTDYSTSSTVNGPITTYNYAAGTASCNSSFITSVSLPLSLTKSTTWNCDGAVATSSTDANSKITNTYYTDPFFWHPISVTDPASATTTFTYVTGTSSSMESAMVFNGNNSISEQLSTMDGFGRTTVSQRQQGYHATNYDSTQTSYDIFGRPFKVTMPYMGTAGQTNTGGPATTTSYDALGRAIQVTDADTGYVKYTYNQNDVLQELGPAPTGGVEHVKQRQLEYDALGRLTSVCEITGGTGNVACGQTNTGFNGYKTGYTYDISPGGYNRVTITQSSQTRVYLYDFMGRVVSETNPESGTTAYTYDTDSTCPSHAGDLVKRMDAVGNITCYSYDDLHRQTSITYSGPYAANTPPKTFVYDTTTFSCPTGANVLGRLAEAYTGPSGSKITDLAYCYSARGETTDVYESTPHSGGYYHVPMSYWENGTMKTFGPFLSEGQVTITPDGEGRPFAINNGGYRVPSILYNAASQPTQLQTSCIGATCYPISYTYDPNTGRMTQYSAALNGGTVSGTLTWNPNGSLKQLVIADPFYTADTQTCNYAADDLSRLTSANCGSAWSQTFTYDPFGNLTKNGSLIWNPGYSQSTNRYTLGGTSYDANGNLLNDTFNTYTWDAEGKNVATVYPAQTWNFTNDAFGHMVEMSFNSIYYQYSYLNLGNIHLSAIGQTPQYSEFPLPGGSKLSQNGGGTGVQLADWLGTIRAFYSYAGGNYALGGAHAPFGETYTTNYGYPMGFAGQESLGWGEGGDGAINNTAYWFPERQYRSNQGRWLSPDPGPMDFSNPQSFNRYAYVNDNPLAAVDPQGLEMCGLMAGGGVGCSGAGDNGSHTGFTDLFSGVYGWGGTSCMIDGSPASCDMTQSLLGSGAGVPCSVLDCNVSYTPGVGFATLTYAADNSISIDYVDDYLAEVLELPTKVSGGESLIPAFKPWDMRGSLVGVLRGKNDCSSWFNQGQGSAANIMSRVPILFGPPDPGPIPGPDAWTSPSPTSPIYVSPNGRFYPGGPNGLPVGGVFQPGSSGARSIILFHELAHKVGLIPSDAFSTLQSDNNTQTVMGHCGGTVR